jgi:hypothetical protein
VLVNLKRFGYGTSIYGQGYLQMNRWRAIQVEEWLICMEIAGAVLEAKVHGNAKYRGETQRCNH